VLPIFLALYILAFSMGIVIFTLSFLAFKRTGHASYRHFSFFFAGVIVYLVADTISLYNRVFTGLFVSTLPYIEMVLSAVGNGVIGYMTPILVYALVGFQFTPRRRALQIGWTALLVVLGVADDLYPGPIPTLVDALALALLQFHGIGILVRNFKRIDSPILKSLIRSIAAYVSVMLAVIMAQIVARSLPRAPAVLREYGLTLVAFYIGAMVLLLVYAGRFLFREGATVPALLPDRFIEQYGISPRECEIISMIVRGYSNRKIGETLFISAMTVKNHIYHIYRKTGVENKVQLLNIINSPK